MRLASVLPWMALLIVVGLAAPPADAAQPPIADSPGFPVLQLPGLLRGEAAVRALGLNLPRVARAYHRTPRDLVTMLREDTSLVVDRFGRLHFAEEPAPTEHSLRAVELTTPSPTLLPLEDTFKLHSRRGAKRVIYLDFNGHVISGTAWNANYLEGERLVALPYDIDGQPSSFSEEELSRIQRIWLRVSEDYAPFDLDVTTEITSESVLNRTRATDMAFGIRVVISPISHRFGNFGGMAYVGAFAAIGDFFKPVLVFPERLNQSEKAIAEAISHEVGHSLGLSHDGTVAGTAYYSGHGGGATSWAPIMGAGYSRNVTQWSRGEYTGADNQEDDVAVILANGLAPIPDDHGDTLGEATNLGPAPDLHAAGIIGFGGDVDVFAFSVEDGGIRLTVQPANPGPNLDVQLELLDEQGSLVASSNPADELSAELEIELPAGTYYARVQGTGAGDPASTGYSTYGSAGQYLLELTAVDTSANEPPDPPFNHDPIPRIRVIPAMGVAPFTVRFDGGSSSDPDGKLVSYFWDFGDGTSATGIVVEHEYTGPGSYIATLTVEDNLGASQSAEITIIAQQNPRTVLRVQSITLSRRRTAAGVVINARIRIADATGQPAPGAVVEGVWFGQIAGSSQAQTDPFGWVTLTSPPSTRTGDVTFHISDVRRAVSTYDPEQNIITTATILAAQGGWRARYPRSDLPVNRH